MKKQLFIIIALVSGLSYETFAATGRTTDGIIFLSLIVGFLLVIGALLSGIDYLKKNGKRMFYRATIKLKRLNILLKDQLLKIKSDYFDLSYF